MQWLTIEPGVGQRIGAHAARPPRRQRRQPRYEAALFVKKLFGPIAPQPGLQDLQVRGVLSHVRYRDLMRAKRVLDGVSVDLTRSGPTLGGAHHDRGPLGSRSHAAGLASALLNVADA